MSANKVVGELALIRLISSSLRRRVALDLLISIEPNIYVHGKSNGNQLQPHGCYNQLPIFQTSLMTTHDEKQAFAARLNLALKRSRKKISTPTELAVQFNLLYNGEPISPQAAQKWMCGHNRPTPDKIVTLAAMLKVSHQWLRFGIPETAHATRNASSPKSETRHIQPTEADVVLIGRLRSLPEHQQELVEEIIEQFALQQEMWSA